MLRQAFRKLSTFLRQRAIVNFGFKNERNIKMNRLENFNQNLQLQPMVHECWPLIAVAPDWPNDKERHRRLVRRPHHWATTFSNASQLSEGRYYFV